MLRPHRGCKPDEGLTSKQIHETAPGWLIFRDGCPDGEAPEQVGERVDRIITRTRAVEGDVALFAHGHVLHVLVARWLGLPVSAWQHFMLDTGTLSVLGRYNETPVVRIWNGPLLGERGLGGALGSEPRSWTTDVSSDMGGDCHGQRQDGGGR